MVCTQHPGEGGIGALFGDGGIFNRLSKAIKLHLLKSASGQVGQDSKPGKSKNALRFARAALLFVFA